VIQATYVFHEPVRPGVTDSHVSRASRTRCRRRSCVIDRLLSGRRRFTVENVLSAFAVSMTIVNTNLLRFNRFACDGGCNVCAAETVVRVRDSSVGLALLKTTLAIGISWDIISSSILQPAFSADVTSGANVAGVKLAVAKEAAAT